MSPTSPPLRRVHLLVRGLVQGVFFRASAAAEAERLRLTGWVRNRTDGSVEAEAQGPAPAVEAFVTWGRRGPSAARVEAVDVQELAPHDDTGHAQGFRVERTS